MRLHVELNLDNMARRGKTVARAAATVLRMLASHIQQYGVRSRRLYDDDGKPIGKVTVQRDGDPPPE